MPLHTTRKSDKTSSDKVEKKPDKCHTNALKTRHLTRHLHTIFPQPRNFFIEEIRHSRNAFPDIPTFEKTDNRTIQKPDIQTFKKPDITSVTLLKNLLSRC
jgi:hypothetical protein